MRAVLFFFQAEDGIRDLVRSRGLGDVYKRQGLIGVAIVLLAGVRPAQNFAVVGSTADGDIAEALSLIHI